ARDAVVDSGRVDTRNRGAGHVHGAATPQRGAGAALDRTRRRELAALGARVRRGRSVSATRTPPRTSRRLAAAVAIGLAAGTYWFYASWANPGGVSDFDQLWTGARAMLAGDNPYQVVRANAAGPVGPFKYNLYYPTPALT